MVNLISKSSIICAIASSPVTSHSTHFSTAAINLFLILFFLLLSNCFIKLKYFLFSLVIIFNNFITSKYCFSSIKIFIFHLFNYFNNLANFLLTFKNFITINIIGIAIARCINIYLIQIIITSHICVSSCIVGIFIF
uniref:Uncharacterized protein n=1 Tax=Clostridium botulinum TaxID=1491 RepID=A0A0A0UVS3_CLOBO|nr:hypothetical protein [Clostridium botulinum]AIW54924.1 hypothetical protein [Clostridium botulinum]AIW54979.1 hypothetical protein [Clostridium botulinum]